MKARKSILLNFVNLKSGGGVQVGMDFLENVRSRETAKDYDWHLLCTRGTPFDLAKVDLRIQSITRVKSGIFGRIQAEAVFFPRLINELKPDVILTLFGPPPLVKNEKSTKVSGCAYSNLFYPDIDFWSGNGVIFKTANLLRDFFRIKSMRKADLVVFETLDLLDRAVTLRGFDRSKVGYVPPSVSKSLLNPPSIKSTTTQSVEKIKGFKILMISAYRHHKNADLIPQILHLLRKNHSVSDIFFILTLEPENKGTQALIRDAKRLDLADKIVNLGPVRPDLCRSLYDSTDMTILPSTLESFSNNIPESWASSRPLLITDKSWARSICKDAALYAKWRDAEDFSERIFEIYKSPELRQSLVSNGHLRLGELPTSSDRFDLYMNTLRRHTAEKKNVA